MIGAKWLDLIVGVDIHWVMVPVPPAPPIPTPLPHPFAGLIFDPAGLVVGAAMSAFTSGFSKGVTLINKMPAASTGTEGTNLMVLPHFPMPPGVVWAPVPAGLKPPIPGKAPDPGLPTPIPSNDATIITGSKTVYIGGSNAARLGDMVMSCGEPVRLPSSTVIAIPMGPPVLVGGPPALDFWAAMGSLIKSSWVSGRLNAIFNKAGQSWRSKLICFFTGHPVDVATGMLMTDSVDLELPGPIPFKLERTYYSRSDYNGSLGFGWAHSYDQHVSIVDNTIVLHDGDGREIYFDLVGVNRSTRNHSERMTLTRLDNNVVIETKDNLKYYFGECGKNNGTWYLQRIEDYNYNRIICNYDKKGFLVQIIDSAGRSVTFENDNSGRILKVLVPDPEYDNDRVTYLQYEYSDEGDLVAVYDALHHPFTYKYKYHLMVQETNRNGLSFYFVYDGIDKDANCVRTWGDGGIYDHVLTYDKKNHVTIVENSLGHKTTYIMNQMNAVVKIVDAKGGTTEFEYDEYDRKISETDPLGNKNELKYDESGNNIEIKDPDGTTIKLIYNSHNLPVKAIDKMGGEWEWQYDDHLRLVEKTDPLKSRSKFIYNNKFLSAFIDPAGYSTYLNIDSQGNLVSITTPDKAVSSYRYDKLGRCLSTVDPMQNVKKILFDILGRPVKINEPDSNIRQFRYDPEDNIVQAVDKQYDVIFEYGGMNKMLARIQNNTTVAFKYDTEEQLIGIENEHGSVYKYNLDTVGDVIVESGFDEIKRVYARDAAGQVIRVDRPEGVYTEFTYDQIGRVTKLLHSDDTKESFIYREDGELIEAKNNDVAVKLERDILGSVIKEFQNDYWVESGYDLLGFRISMSSSMGAHQNIIRNVMGDVEKVMHVNKQFDEFLPWETKFTRDIAGLEIQKDMPGGLQTRWQRDKLGRPIELSINSAAGHVRTRKYTWDVNDRLKFISDSLTGTTTFQHDAFGNLAKATMTDGSSIFRVPDAIGNLFKKENRGDRKYGPAGQLLEATNDKGIVKYEYDSEGNLIKKIEPDNKIWEYHWNASGMLVKVIRPDKNEVTFAYDPLGRRISKTYKGKTTKWVWDGNLILHEWCEGNINTEQNGYQKQTEEYGSYFHKLIQNQLSGRPSSGPPKQGTASKPITWLFEPDSFTPLARMVGDSYLNIVSDHLGTPLAMFDEQGNNTWSMELDIYGQARLKKGQKEDCPFRYPGQYEDTETGLYYNRFRYYDPEVGGYVSQDPIRFAGDNPTFYGYLTDCNIYTDVFGLMPLLGGFTPGGMSRNTSEWLSRFGPASMRDHHLIPQAMLKDKNFMNRLNAITKGNGIDYLHRQISKIPNELHTFLHKNDWNKQFKNWVQNNPMFTKKDLQKQIKAMMKKFQVPKGSRNFSKKYGCK
jgi:RHS repeat-associated protein